MKILNILILTVILQSSFYTQAKNIINEEIDFVSDSNLYPYPIISLRNGQKEISNAINILSTNSAPRKLYDHKITGLDDLNLISLIPDGGLLPIAMAWNQGLTELYGVSVNHELILIDPLTGFGTLIGQFDGILPNEEVTGIAIGRDDTCYVSTTDDNQHNTEASLYQCDLKSSELTLIGSQSIAPDIHDIIVTCNGEIYGYEEAQKKLYSLNRLTGSATLVGNTNLPTTNIVSNLTFDRKSGNIYQYYVCPNSHYTALVTLDKSTGQFTYVSDFCLHGLYIGAIKNTCPEIIDEVFYSGFENITK